MCKINYLRRVRVVLLLVSLILLVSCGKTKNPGGNSNVEGPGIIDVLSDLPDEEITITFWHNYQTEKQDLLDDFIDEFELLYANVSINAISKPFSTIEMTSTVESAYSEGLAPTMIFGYRDTFSELYPSQIVLPLDDFINDDNFGIDLDDFITNAVEESRQFEDGYMYSLPFSKITEIVIINKDKFEANGIEIKTDEPYTWAELDNLASVLVGDGQNQCEYLINYQSPESLFTTAVEQWNGEFINNNGDILVNNENTKAMMEYLRVRFNYNTFSIPELLGVINDSAKFKSEDVCMSVTSVSAMRYFIPNNNEFEIEFGLVPQYDLENQAFFQNGPSIAIIESASDAERLAAWMFMSYITNTENATRWALTSDWLPIRYSSIESDEYQDFLNSPSLEDTFISLAMNASILEIADLVYLPSYFNGPTFPSSRTARVQADLAMIDLATTSLTIQEIIDEMISNLE